MVPIPRGMKEYFANAGVDVSSGLIPSCVTHYLLNLGSDDAHSEFLGIAQYKPICDGLAVKHSNLSEFYETGTVLALALHFE